MEIILFNDSDELKEFAPIDQSYDFEQYQKHLTYCAETYLPVWTGAQLLLNMMNWAIEPSDVDARAEALRLARASVAAFALARAISEGLARPTGGEVGTMETNTKPMPFTFIQASSDQAMETGWNRLEQLLEHLEVNVSSFPEWESSPACTTSRELFISSAKDFQREVDISTSRRLFTCLRPELKSVEKLYIMPEIGMDMFNSIKEELASANVTVESRTLLQEYIRPITAFYAVWQGLTSGSITVAKGGELIYPGVKKADPETSEARAGRFRELGDAHVRQLRTYLKRHASPTSYPLYYNSDLYQSGEIQIRTNDPKLRTFYL